ncbi:hypothetical protein JB92DRAFT_2985084 [Gautieria morchelliformis]|nr:hypothetical protein JB92DRAFT_2985084 [Gautieria morchelliformis]
MPARAPWTKISILHVLIRYYALGYLVVNAYVSVFTNFSVEGTLFMLLGDGRPLTCS